VSEPTIKEMCLAVAKALEDESRWCRGTFARTAANRPVDIDHPKACRWCVEGHTKRLFGDRCYVLLRAYNSASPTPMFEDNDRRDRGREYVRARLLELAEAQP
jgi:hypothetical protein